MHTTVRPVPKDSKRGTGGTPAQEQSARVVLHEQIAAVEGGSQVHGQICLQQEADQGPPSRSLLQLRHELNGSPRVQSLLALQAMADRSSRVMTQRKLRDEISIGHAPIEQESQGQLQLPSDAAEPAIQREESPANLASNRTGLPDQLKAGVESLSGLSMDDVRVHYNSPKPNQLQALAYAQGTDIHVAPGQEKYLAHEAWHVVQQKQSRVQPTLQMQKGVAVNDDIALEKEADVMGAKAGAARSGTVSPSTISRARPSSLIGPGVVQGWWVLKGVPVERQQAVKESASSNAFEGFILLLTLLNQEDELNYLKSNLSLLGSLGVPGFLAKTFAEEKDGYNSRYLFQKIQEVVDNQKRALEVHLESDESDHPEGADAQEELIDWSDLTGKGLERLPKVVLYAIFQNLAAYHFEKAGERPEVNLVAAFQSWYEGGIHTRARFKNLIGLGFSESDHQEKIIQLARTGNSYSQQDSYTGKNGVGYKNVIYYRDTLGNIDFTRSPASIVSAYNSAAGTKLTSSDITWSNPQDTGSEIQMSQDLKDPTKGVMPSGKQVSLPKASRPQHFAIADMLYPNSRKSTWTWHHLTPKYKMVLVDMTVHAKHGHNGGVYIW